MRSSGSRATNARRSWRLSHGRRARPCCVAALPHLCSTCACSGTTCSDNGAKTRAVRHSSSRPLSSPTRTLTAALRAATLARTYDPSTREGASNRRYRAVGSAEGLLGLHRHDSRRRRRRVTALTAKFDLVDDYLASLPAEQRVVVEEIEWRWRPAQVASCAMTCRLGRSKSFPSSTGGVEAARLTLSRVTGRRF